MKRILYLLIFFITFPIFADLEFGHTNFNEILIVYTFVDYNNDNEYLLRRIEIHIYKIDSSNIYIKILTRNIKYKNELNVEYLKIDEEYYNTIFEKLLNIDFNDIILANTIFEYNGGEHLSISIGTFGCSQHLSISNPFLNIRTRKLELLNIVLIEIFKNTNLLDYYGNLSKTIDENL